MSRWSWDGFEMDDGFKMIKLQNSELIGRHSGWK